MDRTQLEQVYRKKIHDEFKMFEQVTLQKSKEDIMESAYRIVSMTIIFECLLEYSGQMEEKELHKYIQTQGLLEFLYGEWLKNPDTPQEHSLWSFITKEQEV